MVRANAKEDRLQCRRALVLKFEHLLFIFDSHGRPGSALAGTGPSANFHVFGTLPERGTTYSRDGIGKLLMNCVCSR